MVAEMSLRLEKLVEDIKEETILWPIENAKNTSEEEAAWAKVGAKHNMTGSHVKSIFKVLSKKYEVEKNNPTSEWKLFSHLTFLDSKDDIDPENEDGEEFVELLEVNEEYCSDDEEPNTSGGSNPPEQTNKPVANVKEQSLTQPAPVIATQTTQLKEVNLRKVGKAPKKELNEKDLKNGQYKRLIKETVTENGVKGIAKSTIIKRVSPPPPQKRIVRVPLNKSNASGVSEDKKTQSTLTQGLKLAVKKDDKAPIITSTPTNFREVKIIKRKVPIQSNQSKINENEDEETNSPPIKKQILPNLPKGIKVLPAKLVQNTQLSINVTSTPSNTILNEIQIKSSPKSSPKLSPPNDNKLPPFSSFMKRSAENLNQIQTSDDSKQIKEEPITDNDSQEDISSEQNQQQQQNPAKRKRNISPKSSKSSSFSPKSNKNRTDCGQNEGKLKIEEISKDADENTEIKVKVLTEQAEKILPSFFRDLYNSKKYDSFGMYVSSTMNRLPSLLASKLEAKILQSIIEVNALADEMQEAMDDDSDDDNQMDM